MENIKNLKLYKKGLSVLLAAATTVTLSSCSGYADMKSLTPSEVLSISEVQDVTMVDEMIEAGKLRYEDDMTIIEAADQLERFMDISDMLKNVNLEGADQLSSLTADEYNQTLNLNVDEVNLLIEMASYNGKDVVKQEQRVNAVKRLNYLYNYCNEWIRENGQDVSIKYMMAAIKGAVADELDLSVDDYSSITIPSASLSDEATPYTIKVDEQRYEVKESVGELWNDINYIYAVQDYDPENGNEFETYRKAINFAKTAMAAGANVKNNNLEEQYNASYIEKNYTK